ncbi:MAG: diaminopimelate epimerase [Pseudomonadota bacterium]
MKMNMNIEFHKLTGIGNDYVYFEGLKTKLPEAEIISKVSVISDRRFGIGGDGVILVLPSKKADARMRIFNMDGSEAEICGNGVRSVMRLLNTLDPKKNKISVETNAGIVTGEILGDDIRAKLFSPPQINSTNENIESNGQSFTFHRVNVGNPHAVIKILDIKNFNVRKYGEPIENNLKLFPERTNVEFYEEVAAGEIRMRVWERGSGETLACGTGAAAAAAVYRFTNNNRFNDVKVDLLGGRLIFNWTDSDFYMTGPAKYLFSGKLDLKSIETK